MVGLTATALFNAPGEVNFTIRLPGASRSHVDVRLSGVRVAPVSLLTDASHWPMERLGSSLRLMASRWVPNCSVLAGRDRVAADRGRTIGRRGRFYKHPAAPGSVSLRAPATLTLRSGGRRGHGLPRTRKSRACRAT